MTLRRGRSPRRGRPAGAVPAAAGAGGAALVRGSRSPGAAGAAVPAAAPRPLGAGGRGAGPVPAGPVPGARRGGGGSSRGPGGRSEANVLRFVGKKGRSLVPVALPPLRGYPVNTSEVVVQ